MSAPDIFLYSQSFVRVCKIILYIFTVQRLDLNAGSRATERCAVCIKDRRLLSSCSLVPAATFPSRIIRLVLKKTTRNGCQRGVFENTACCLQVPGHILGLKSGALTQFLQENFWTVYRLDLRTYVLSTVAYTSKFSYTKPLDTA